MKKKLLIILSALIVIAVILFSPVTPLAATGLSALTATTSPYQYTAPAQKTVPFQQSTTDYNLDNWQKNTNDNLTVLRVTNQTNDTYHNNTTYRDITLDSSQIGKRNPYLLLANKANTKTSGNLSLNEITLAANSYYEIAVEYWVMGDPADQCHFYLGDYDLPLHARGAWHTAKFMIQTDRLVATTLSALLYFGSPNQEIYGAAYFCDLTVTALPVTTFNNTVASLDSADQVYYNLTDHTAVEEVQVVTNTDFTAPTSTQPNVIVTNNINNNLVATRLNFTDDHHTFYAKDGQGDVMLMAAHGNNTRLTLSKYTFQPLPHAVYMFQFYSLMPSDLAQFYFCVGNTYQKITAVEYPNYNGWQLNTIFYTAGYDAKQEFMLSFVLGNEDEGKVTGWVALDDLRIYRVAGDYAVTNANALGVQGTNELNSAEDWSVANGNFELGTAANVNSNTYPYPLKADSWTTEQTTNGIVNTAFWYFNGLDNPGKINQNYRENNNIYMLHNGTATTNQVTSPTLTTTAGETTYFSFDAHALDTAPLSVSFQTTDGVELSKFTIQDNTWRHYELAITEHANAASRAYQLVFTLQKAGTAFLDNFRSDTEFCPFDDANATTLITVDLTSPVNLTGLWQTTDNTVADKLAIGFDRDGITLRNEEQTTIVTKYGLDYNLTTDNYYRVSLTARGENAFIELNGFDDYFTVKLDANTPDALTTYNFYCQATSTTTTLNLLVTLGSKDVTAFNDGHLYITALTVTEMTETDYNLATKNLSANDKLVKVATATDDKPTDNDSNDSDKNNFFGENWWYLIPTLITAIAIVLAVFSFLWRRTKFNKHITHQTTTYARDMQLKDTHKKIVAEKSAKVDNIKDETSHNN